MLRNVWEEREPAVSNLTSAKLQVIYSSGLHYYSPFITKDIEAT